MYNWSTEERELKKNEEKYVVWRMEQVINFGLGKDKINREELEKHWSKLRIDPARRKFLEILLNK